VVIPVNWQIALHASGIAKAVPTFIYCFISITYQFLAIFLAAAAVIDFARD
jgi:hypothetical protein